MLQRTITGIIAVAVVVLLMFVRGIIMDIAVVIIILGALWEEYSAFRAAGREPVYWPGLVSAALLIPAYKFFGAGSFLALTFICTMLVMLAVCRREKPDFLDAAMSVYPIYTVFLPLAMMFVLLHAGQPRGVQLLGFALIVAIAGDTFAYFSGVLFGKHKLAPSVSPNKTIEGAVGGLVGSVLFGMAYVGLFGILGYEFGRVLDMVILSIVGGIAGQIGDLTASLLKRYCGIKDFGTIFPGHGGIMDRADSILFTLMVVCSYAMLWVSA